MLVEEVDAVGLQALQRGFGDGADALGAAVNRLLRVAVLEAELGGENHLVAKWSRRFADEFLVDERAITLGGVEERDALLESSPNQRDAFRFFSSRAIAETQTHAAKADG